MIIATAATLYAHGIHSVDSASDAAKALEPFAGQYAEALFGIGLLGASLLACAILPIATSYVVSESLGFEEDGPSRPSWRRAAPIPPAGLICLTRTTAVFRIREYAC